MTSNAADQIWMDTTNPSGQVNIVSFSVNGNWQSQNKWTIDGVDNVDHGSNITLLVYPSVDAISEFKVSRSNARGIFQGPLCTAVDSDGTCTATGTQITDIDPGSGLPARRVQ